MKKKYCPLFIASNISWVDSKKLLSDIEYTQRQRKKNETFNDDDDDDDEYNKWTEAFSLQWELNRITAVSFELE